MANITLSETPSSVVSGFITNALVGNTNTDVITITFSSASRALLEQQMLLVVTIYKNLMMVQLEIISQRKDSYKEEDHIEVCSSPEVIIINKSEDSLV